MTALFELPAEANTADLERIGLAVGAYGWQVAEVAQNVPENRETSARWPPFASA